MMPLGRQNMATWVLSDGVQNTCMYENQSEDPSTVSYEYSPALEPQKWVRYRLKPGRTRLWQKNMPFQQIVSNITMIKTASRVYTTMLIALCPDSKNSVRMVFQS